MEIKKFKPETDQRTVETAGSIHAITTYFFFSNFGENF
jgi:hypothetical protein